MRSRLLPWMQKVLIALRDVQASYAEQDRLIAGELRQFSVLVYMDGLESSERERFNAAMKDTEASPSPGTSIDISLLRPRRDTHVLYCVAHCATSTHALHMVTGLVSHVLFTAGLSVTDVRAWASELAGEDRNR